MHLRSRQVQKTIHSLRQHGYAVVVRKPNEQGTFDRRAIEHAMQERADTLIEIDQHTAKAMHS